nr:MAG TPA: hypothetical protein [Podoviridae sp. ctJ6o53]
MLHFSRHSGILNSVNISNPTRTRFFSLLPSFRVSNFYCLRRDYTLCIVNCQ